MATFEQIFNFMLGRSPSAGERLELGKLGAEALVISLANGEEFDRATLEPFLQCADEVSHQTLSVEEISDITMSVLFNVGFGYAPSAQIVQFDRRIPAVIYALTHSNLAPQIRKALPPKLFALRCDRPAMTDDVTMCYRTLLGRDPESVEAVENSAFVYKASEVVEAMLDSDEYKHGRSFIRKEGERSRLPSWDVTNLLLE